MSDEIQKWINGVLNITETRNGIDYGNIDTLINECEENQTAEIESTLTLNENIYDIKITLTKTIPEEITDNTETTEETNTNTEEQETNNDG